MLSRDTLKAGSNDGTLARHGSWHMAMWLDESPDQGPWTVKLPIISMEGNNKSSIAYLTRNSKRKEGDSRAIADWIGRSS